MASGSGQAEKQHTEGPPPLLESSQDVIRRVLQAMTPLFSRKKPFEGLPLIREEVRDKLLLSLKTQPDKKALAEACEKAMHAMEDMSQRLRQSLHLVSKNLHFWLTRAQGSEWAKLQFMLLERGPWTFFSSLARVAQAWLTDQPPDLTTRAAVQIAERLKMLELLSQRLASTLAEVHSQAAMLEAHVEERGAAVILETLRAIERSLHNLEDVYDLPQEELQASLPPAETRSIALHLGRAHQTKSKDGPGTDNEHVLKDVENLLEVLEEHMTAVEEALATLMKYYRRPRRGARHWIRYTGAALGLAVATGWAVKHSRLAGSGDLDNWMKQGQDSAAVFFKDHLIDPLVQIRDDLFETYRRRPQSSTQLEEVHLSTESLRRMLTAFCDQAGVKLKPDATDQELMEVVMGRYEKELMHPLTSLLGGELARAMLIQVQKLKLDIEMAMLELDQILRANEINFAVLAALPALFVLIGSIGVYRQIALSKGKGAEGRGRAAQLKRRLLLADVERYLLQVQLISEQKKVDVTPHLVGMTIYKLDLLYKAAHAPAAAVGEWPRLREDILDIAEPAIPLEYKLHMTARMSHLYECLAPVARLR
eukprot:SM000157S02079  [mRNA]  locus=s157:156074:160332:- [translate_table: standard]